MKIFNYTHCRKLRARDSRHVSHLLNYTFLVNTYRQCAWQLTSTWNKRDILKGGRTQQGPAKVELICAIITNEQGRGFTCFWTWINTYVVLHKVRISLNFISSVIQVFAVELLQSSVFFNLASILDFHYVCISLCKNSTHLLFRVKEINNMIYYLN